MSDRFLRLQAHRPNFSSIAAIVFAIGVENDFFRVALAERWRGGFECVHAVGTKLARGIFKPRLEPFMTGHMQLLDSARSARGWREVK